MDNLKSFTDPEDAAQYVLDRHEAYPVRVVDDSDRVLYYVVSPERMEKIFKATEEAAVWNYIHGGSAR